jgi:hypothetical protein
MLTFYQLSIDNTVYTVLQCKQSGDPFGRGVVAPESRFIIKGSAAP